MKLFKWIDLIGQGGVLIGGVVYIAYDKNNTEFTLLYFLVGGWQLLSFFIHIFLTESWIRTKERSWYGKTIAWTGITGIVSYLLLSTAGALLLLYLGALLIFTPMFAIWYFIIGITELDNIKKKELIHLK